MKQTNRSQFETVAQIFICWIKCIFSKIVFDDPRKPGPRQLSNIRQQFIKIGYTKISSCFTWPEKAVKCGNQIVSVSCYIWVCIRAVAVQIVFYVKQTGIQVQTGYRQNFQINKLMPTVWAKWHTCHDSNAFTLKPEDSRGMCGVSPGEYCVVNVSVKEAIVCRI